MLYSVNWKRKSSCKKKKSLKKVGANLSEQRFLEVNVLKLGGETLRKVLSV